MADAGRLGHGGRGDARTPEPCAKAAPVAITIAKANALSVFMEQLLWVCMNRPNSSI